MAKRLFVLGTRGIPNVQGGVENHVENLYPILVSKGYEVTVLCRSCYFRNARVRPNRYLGIKLEYLYAPQKKSLEAIVHTFLGVI